MWVLALKIPSTYVNINKELGLLAQITKCCKLMIDRCSTYKLTNSAPESDKDDFTHDDYYKINQQSNGERYLDKESFIIAGLGERDIRTPQQRMLDWIISILIK